MTPWDFYTYGRTLYSNPRWAVPLTEFLAYGPVLRMQSDLMVPPTTRDTKKAHGEWETLQYSNKLLGKFLHCTDNDVTNNTPAHPRRPFWAALSALYGPRSQDPRQINSRGGNHHLERGTTPYWITALSYES